MSYDKRNPSLLRRMVFEQEAATSAEYAFVLALVIVAAVATLAMFGSQLGGTTSILTNEVPGAGPGPGGSFGPGNFRTRTGVQIP